jgi:hypothetical protein
MLSKLNHWHKTKPGLLVFGLVELLIALGLGSWTFGNGNLWLWLLTIFFLVGGLQNIFKLIGKLFHGRKSRNS